MILPSLIYLAPQHPETLDIRHRTRASFCPAWNGRGLLNSGEISAVYHTGLGPVDETASFFHRVSVICYNYRSNSGIGTELCK